MEQLDWQTLEVETFLRIVKATGLGSLIVIGSWIIYDYRVPIWTFLSRMWRGIMSRYITIRRADPGVAARPQRHTETVATPSATPCNACKEALHGVADVEDAMIATIAMLIKESRRRAFNNGRVPETRSLEVVFGVTRSSDSTSRYQALRTKLHALLSEADPPAYPPLTDDQAETREWLEADLAFDEA